MQTNRVNICIFASGNGSNAINLICESLKFNYIHIVGLVCDNPNAKVLEGVSDFNIPIYLIPFNKSKTFHEGEILKVLSGLDVHWIFLAGYMRILSPFFVSHFKLSKERSRIINIHPSLLPNFKGKNAYEQAYIAGVDQSGVTIHFVDSGVDTGEIIMQRKFYRLKEDTFMDFKNRGMQVEHQLYPEMFKIISHDSIISCKDI